MTKMMLETLLITILFIVSFTAEVVKSPENESYIPHYPNFGFEPSNESVDYTPLYLEVRTNKNVYGFGEDIWVAVTLHNPTNSSYRLVFGSSHEFNVLFYDLYDNLIWDYFSNCFFLAMMGAMTLGPYENHSFYSIVWNQTIEHFEWNNNDIFSWWVWYEPIYSDGYIIRASVVGYEEINGSCSVWI